jgi:membrane protease YdiL (CAAX protease family)
MQFPLTAGAASWRVVGIMLWQQLTVVPYAVAMAIYFGMTRPDATSAVMSHLFSSTGFFITGILQLALTLPLLLKMATFSNWPWQRTLALVPVPLKQLGQWVGWLVLMLIIDSGLSLLVEVKPEAMMLQLNGSRNWGFAFLAVVMAPVLEEAVFRGYAFTAWRHSRLGLLGTLVLTSSFWAVLHAVTYREFYSFLLLFLQGILFGLAREKTGSVLTPMLLHALNNLLVVVVVVFLGLYEV